MNAYDASDERAQTVVENGDRKLRKRVRRPYATLMPQRPRQTGGVQVVEGKYVRYLQRLEYALQALTARLQAQRKMAYRSLTASASNTSHIQCQ